MRVENFPAPGTKVAASEFIITGGGCAANAAVAIARLGGRVAFAGPLGGSTFVAVHRLPQLPLPGVNVAVLVMPSVVPAATVPLTAMATLPYAGTLMPVMLMTLPLPLAGAYDYQLAVPARRGLIVSAPLGPRESIGVVWGPGEGTIDAADKRAALLQLERSGHVPVSVAESGTADTPAPAKASGKKISFLEWRSSRKRRMKCAWRRMESFRDFSDARRSA